MSRNDTWAEDRKRSQIIDRLTAAIATVTPASSGDLSLTREALAIVLATVHLAANRKPFDVVRLQQIAERLLDTCDES